LFKANGLPPIVLDDEQETGADHLVAVNARLTAESFYAKAGFQRVGRPFPSKKTAVPHVQMTLEVSDSNQADPGH